jgi:hypothetical protein
MNKENNVMKLTERDIKIENEEKFWKNQYYQHF